MSHNRRCVTADTNRKHINFGRDSRHNWKFTALKVPSFLCQNTYYDSILRRSNTNNIYDSLQQYVYFEKP